MEFNYSPYTVEHMPEDSLPLVSIVMPCLNEERTIAVCVRKGLNELTRLGLSGEIVVSDNGSTDESVSLAKQAGARVVSCPDKGYGNAIQYGVKHSRGEFIIMGDADDSYDFSSIEPFIRLLQDGADLVMGNRFRGGILPGAMPWKNRYLGNPFLSWFLNLLFHTGIKDAHCGLRGFSRSAFEQMTLECPGMEFASEMVVKASKRCMKIVETPTKLHPDGRGRPPHLNPWRDGWRHLKFLLMFSPLHLFVIPGLLLAFAGLLLMLFSIRGISMQFGLNLGLHSMALGSLLLIVGIQVSQFGVAARLYTVKHRFPENDLMLTWFQNKASLEQGILLGGTLFTIGFLIDSWIAIEWIESSFGALQRVQPALLATTLMAVGTQTLFFSFLLAIIDHSPKREATNTETQHKKTFQSRDYLLKT